LPPGGGGGPPPQRVSEKGGIGVANTRVAEQIE